MQVYNDNTYGGSVANDNNIVIRRDVGVSVEDSRNLSVKVVDAVGVPVEGATVTVYRYGQKQDYITDSLGTVALYIEDPISYIKIEASKECLTAAYVETDHQGEGFYKSIELTILQLPCLYPDPVNENNFIRWQLSNNISLPVTGSPETCQDCGGSIETSNTKLPNAYIKFWKEPYFPVLVPGEQMSFYINTPQGINYSNFSNLRIVFLNSSWETVTDSINALKQEMLPGGGYRIYASFEVPAVKYGRHRLVIYDQSTNIVLYVSNVIRVMTEGYGNETVKVKYRHSKKGYYYDWPAGFYQEVRLHLSMTDPQSPKEGAEEYKELTTGAYYDIGGSLEDVSGIETAYFDQEAHKAMRLAFQACDELYLNDREYKRKDNYQIEFNKLSNRWKGKINLIDQEFARLNRGN